MKIKHWVFRLLVVGVRFCKVLDMKIINSIIYKIYKISYLKKNYIISKKSGVNKGEDALVLWESAFTYSKLTIEIPAFTAGIYLLKFNNRKTRTMCEICSKLTIKTPERRHCRHSGVFIDSFEHISHLALVFLLSTLHMQLPFAMLRPP